MPFTLCVMRQIFDKAGAKTTGGDPMSQKSSGVPVPPIALILIFTGIGIIFLRLIGIL